MAVAYTPVAYLKALDVDRAAVCWLADSACMACKPRRTPNRCCQRDIWQSHVAAHPSQIAWHAEALVLSRAISPLLPLIGGVRTASVRHPGLARISTSALRKVATDTPLRLYYPLAAGLERCLESAVVRKSLFSRRPCGTTACRSECACVVGSPAACEYTHPSPAVHKRRCPIFVVLV